MTSRDKKVAEEKESQVKAEIGAQSAEIIIKQPLSSCRATDHTVLHTGYLKPIHVYDCVSWLLFEVLLKNLSFYQPQEKGHLFEVRMKTSVSPNSSTLHTDSSL